MDARRASPSRRTLGCASSQTMTESIALILSAGVIADHSRADGPPIGEAVAPARNSGPPSFG